MCPAQLFTLLSFPVYSPDFDNSAVEEDKILFPEQLYKTTCCYLLCN